MPYLKIDGCGECPHVGFNNYILDVMHMPDMCAIRCEHPQQESNEYRSVRIRNVNHNIYFNCPLMSEESEEDDD